MIGIIELDNMEFHAYHGCMEEEKIIGNTFLVNLKVKTDVGVASKTDKIEDALNYQELYNIVKKEMAQTSDLLEHVGKRIIDAVKSDFGDKAIEVIVTVSKVNPPLGGKLDKVSLTLHS